MTTTHTYNYPCPVEITPGARLVLKDQDGSLIFDESYPDIPGLIIDINDVISPYFSHSLPKEGDDIVIQKHLVQNFQHGENIIKIYSHPSNIDLEHKKAFSDIQHLRVPYDYICPISVFSVSEAAVKFVNLYGKEIKAYGKVLLTDKPSESTDSPYPITIFTSLPQISCPMRVKWDGCNLSAIGPVLIPEHGHFEQYLFANRFGGFDNIPMDGKLTDAPEFNFKTGHTGDSSKTVKAQCTRRYQQNSGFLERQTIETLMKLLLSKQIYHRKDGGWKQIVILSCDTSLSAQDNLHSISFEYKYIDEE